MGLGTSLAADTAVNFLQGAAYGDLNGTTPVTAVAAPASGRTRLVKNLVVYNKDTASVTVTFQRNVSGTTYVFRKETIASGASFVFPDIVVLVGTTQSLEIVMSAAAATTNPQFNVALAEAF